MNSRRPISTFEQKVDWLVTHAGWWYGKMPLGENDHRRMIAEMKRDGLISPSTNACDAALKGAIEAATMRVRKTTLKSYGKGNHGR